MDAVTYVSMREKTDAKRQPLVRIVQTPNTVALFKATFDPATGERIAADTVVQIFPEKLAEERKTLMDRVAAIDAFLADIAKAPRLA